MSMSRAQSRLDKIERERTSWPEFDAIGLASKFAKLVERESDRAIVNTVRMNLATGSHGDPIGLRAECARIVDSSDELLKAVGDAAVKIERAFGG